GEADVGEANLQEGVRRRCNRGGGGVKEPEPLGRESGEDAPPVAEVVRGCRVGDARPPGDLPHAQGPWAPEPYLVDSLFRHGAPQVAVVVAMAPAAHLRRIAPILTATRCGS